MQEPPGQGGGEHGGHEHHQDGNDTAGLAVAYGFEPDCVRRVRGYQNPGEHYGGEGRRVKR